MQANFPEAMARVGIYEGGKVDNPADPGGRTAYGVTQVTYNSWRDRQTLARQDVFLITKAEVAAIFKGDYWDRVYGDDMPGGLDFCLFDAAVNSGVGSAAMWLQAALSIPVDGDFGPQTKAAAIASDNDDALIKSICARRLGTLKRLRTWSTFGKGWAARIANVQKTAIAMHDSVPGSASTAPLPVDVSSAGGHRKADIDDVKPPIIPAIAAHVTTVAGAAGASAAQATQTLTPLADTFAWIKYILAGLTLLGASAAIATMLAKQANDAAQSGDTKVTPSLTADSAFPTVPLTAGAK